MVNNRRYTEEERMIIFEEVIKVVEGNKNNIAKTRYGVLNGVTSVIIDNILKRGVNRTEGALLVQIGACTTGCYINDANFKWSKMHTAQVYRKIYLDKKSNNSSN